MATEVAINTDKTQKFIDHLEARKTILSSCTQLFTTLTTHFTSLQNSLSEKSQTLDSKFESLQTNSQQTLESLSQRETSIPERESAAAAKVHEQKENALAEFQKPFKIEYLSDALKSFARRMDSSGLLKFIMSKRKESVSLREKISSAIMEAVDPAVLILDAVDEFVSNKIDKLGVTDKRWACGLLVQVLFPEGGRRQKGPEFGRSVVERAAKILNKWKEEQVGGEGGGGGFWGPAEAVMFLQMVVAFGLKSRFEDEFLMKLVMEHAWRRDMARLAVAIGFGEKMGEIIDELVKNGKEIEAVYFASESGLTERFSLVSLLKSYIRNSSKDTSNVLKNGNYSPSATDESNTAELNSIKAVIKCVEDHNLEPEFPLDVLKKKASRLERELEKKKTKSKNKRAHGGPSSSSRNQKPPFRPAKVAKFSNAATTTTTYLERKLEKKKTYLERRLERQKIKSEIYLERRLERKKIKSENKRAHGGPSSSSINQEPPIRPAKVAKFSNTTTTTTTTTTYSPYPGWRNLAPMPHHSPVARYSGVPYNYPPSQSIVYDGHSTPYPTNYGVSHSQPPAVIPQQHYTISTENVAGVSNFRAGTSYGVQGNYVAYDYGTPAPPAYQSTPYTQQ